MSTSDAPFYEKYLFIPLEEPIGRKGAIVLINQLYEALASPVATIDEILAGPDRKLAIRVTYRMDGIDPDEALDDLTATLNGGDRP